MNQLIISLLVLSTTITSYAATDGLSSNNAEINPGPYWFHRWTMNDQKQKVDLKSVTGYDQGLLLTFSGADYSYLNLKDATEFKPLGNDVYEWTYQDQKVEYKRVYAIHDRVADVSVSVKFKEKTPESAFLNVVSTPIQDQSAEKSKGFFSFLSSSPSADEKRYQELFYFTNSKIERQLLDDVEDAAVKSPVKWVGAGSHYYIFTVMPETSPEAVLLRKTGEQTAQASMQYPVAKDGTLNLKFKVVFAPKHLDTLRSIERSLDTTVDLGFFAFIAYPILLTLKFIYKFVGNYGLAIILLTILIKLLTFPLVVKSVKSMKKMADFQPKIKALQAKHGDNKQAFNQEMMLLMKQTGYNPMAGCFPMLLQMPIFFALYRALDTAVELKNANFLYIADLSARDPYLATPILMSLVMFVQQHLTPPSPGMDPAQQKMMKFMPLIFGGFMLMTPAGLCVYMLVNSVVSVAQQQYLNKKLGVSGSAAGIATSF
jgi:YidC/Oxa1 family membrane protein insertase